MSAKDIWHRWQNFLEPAPENNGSDEDEEVTLGRIFQQQNVHQEEGMTQAQQADIAALLAQLTAANIARDAAIAVNAAARTREDNLRASTGKIDKCTGDDKRKLRR